MGKQNCWKSISAIALTRVIIIIIILILQSPLVSHRNALSKALSSTSHEGPASLMIVANGIDQKMRPFDKKFLLYKKVLYVGMQCVQVNIYEALSPPFFFCFFLLHWKWRSSHKVPGPESELPARRSKAETVLVLQCSSFSVNMLICTELSYLRLNQISRKKKPISDLWGVMRWVLRL